MYPQNDYRYYLMHSDDDYIMHYGVLGMKWGVRRYQNEDGSLTKAGLKRQARKDRSQTFKTGRKATVIGKAADKATKVSVKADARYLRNPVVRNLRKKMTANSIEESLMNDYFKALDEYKSAAEKTNTPVNYNKKTGKVEARVESWPELAASAAITIGSAALMVAGISPISVVALPKSAKQRGNSYYRQYKKLYKNLPLTMATNTNRTSNNAPIAMLTADQARRLGYDESTKVPDAEAQEIWKEIYRQQTSVKHSDDFMSIKLSDL